MRDLLARIEGFSKIVEEIEVEVATLSLNEEARRLFVSFKDICAYPSCGLFLGSSDSYGKNLLYLRDQVKDLQSSSDGQYRRVVQLREYCAQLTEEIEELEQSQDARAETTEVAGLIKAVGELQSRVFDLQRELQAVEELQGEERSHVELQNERDSLQDEIAMLSRSGGQIDLRATEVRAALRDRVRHWLDVLDTKNVSRDLAIDSDFGFLFGEEKISQFHGSTLTRIILAIRTAVFEVYANDQDGRMRFLVLDTPRQQDLETAALAGYMAELKGLAVEHEVQIIFSTTEYHYESGSGDVEWEPSFPGVEQNMFLG